MVAASDVVLLEIGANDLDVRQLPDASCRGSVLCWSSELERLDSNLRGILSTIHQVRPSAVVAVLGYWNIGLSGAVGAARGTVYVRNARVLTDSLNRIVQKDSAADGAVYVDAYAAFGSDDRAMTSLLAADGDHPNVRGHDVLAAAVVSALRAAGE